MKSVAREKDECCIQNNMAQTKKEQGIVIEDHPKKVITQWSSYVSLATK